ncbi:MAG: cytochrome P450 [Henriciella sp.]|nr:cytochrome P450 [Henriciella sp.]
MADTAHDLSKKLERPKLSYREPARPHYLERGDPVPPASELDMATLDLVDVEVWRQDKMWDRFERLRKEDPLHWTPDSFLGPYWSVTRYKDIMAIDTDHKRFSSDQTYGGITLGNMQSGLISRSFISSDEPIHSAQRKVAQPAVAPTMLRNYEPLIRQRTCDVLDNLPVGEPFDWVDAVSIELTAMMLATLFNYPQEKRRELTRWSDVTTNPRDPDICPGGMDQWRAELTECMQVFWEIFQARKAAPPADDLMSLLAHGEATKDMDQFEMLGNVILLIIGGNDTTRNSMSGGVYALNKFPEEFDKLRADHSLIPNMVSEIIRWQTPLAYMRRTALEDVEMHGKTIRKGDQIAMWYVSGNRDEDFWNEDPNRLIIDRKQARNHLSFGFGIHRCVGNRLGELQLRILWEEILARFDHVEVIDEPSRVSSSFVKGYSWLPVVLHTRT